MSNRPNWIPELLLDHGIRPWEMDDFTPSEWQALVDEVGGRRHMEGLNG